MQQRRLPFMMALLVTDGLMLVGLMIMLGARSPVGSIDWLNSRGGEILMPWLITKLILAAWLYYRAGGPFQAIAWAWLTLAKLLALHLWLAPWLALHAIPFATILPIPALVFAKILALAAIGALALGLLLQDLDRQPNQAVVALTHDGLVAMAMLAAVSVLPEIAASLLPEPYLIVATMGELLGETLVISWIVWVAWRRLPEMSSNAWPPATTAVLVRHPINA